MRYPGGLRGPERIRPGLERILAAFERTGHPERAFRTVHIAGTNGKGSTACFTDAILRQLLAEPVGLYTSPHLLSPEERIRVEGEKIPSEEFRRYASRVAGLSRKVAATAGEPLSYFEEMTWIACDWFRRRGVSLAVMETGLGGRWDATNLCIPWVSVITNVGRDHAEWLGTSLKAIASEKAGILREKTIAVLGKLKPAARKVITGIARERGCPVWEIGRELCWEDAPGGGISIHLPGISLPRMKLRMHGEFQRDNALLACAAAWVVAEIRGDGGAGFEKAARFALAEAKWPGRYAPLPGRRNAGAWVDGAHNPAAAAALSRELAKRKRSGNAERIVALWSMLIDKDIPGFLRVVAPVVDGFVAYPMEGERAAPLSVLAGALKKAGIRHREAGNFSDGWKTARRWAGKDGMVIVCGSLMAAADAYRFRGGEVA
ncbi:MAG TPA: Mur ligase family protein [Candidatus Deferrimicrobiaceae bacterium]|nr:Mur ligase family protein [Candidatus Deferrimicrobiaceae bacterium]